MKKSCNNEHNMERDGLSRKKEGFGETKSRRPSWAAALPYTSCRISALAELRRAAGGLEAVFLAFLHTGIAGQETGLLQDGAVILAGQQQGPSNAVAQGAGLAGHAAAGNGGYDVHLTGVAGGLQGLGDDAAVMGMAPVPLGNRCTRATEDFRRPVPYR